MTTTNIHQHPPTSAAACTQPLNSHQAPVLSFCHKPCCCLTWYLLASLLLMGHSCCEWPAAQYPVDQQLMRQGARGAMRLSPFVAQHFGMRGVRWLQCSCTCEPSDQSGGKGHAPRDAANAAKGEMVVDTKLSSKKQHTWLCDMQYFILGKQHARHAAVNQATQSLCCTPSSSRASSHLTCVACTKSQSRCQWQLHHIPHVPHVPESRLLICRQRCMQLLAQHQAERLPLVRADEAGQT